MLLVLIPIATTGRGQPGELDREAEEHRMTVMNQHTGGLEQAEGCVGVRLVMCRLPSGA